MARYAQVIVDVPAMQTNRPYTYELPQALQAQAQVGMRVIVPFGKGERQIQGFIVGLTDEYGLSITPKQVISLMDLAPVLNNEALQLADWLAQKTFSFKIRCLQVMLPNAMRASYSKSLRLLSADELPQELNSLFTGKSEIEFDESKLYSTWSVDSFFFDMLSESTVNIGTNEKIDYQKDCKMIDLKNGFLEFKDLAIDKIGKTYYPKGKFEAFIVPHEETITIAKSLEVKNENEAIYRPTVMFLYSPCDFAVKYLTNNTKRIIGSNFNKGLDILATNKDVIIIGGGDTGTDCVGTAIRQGCKSVNQFEIMGEPLKVRGENNPWPEYAKILKIDYGQEECIAKFGRDPRRYLTSVKEFYGDDVFNNLPPKGFFDVTCQGCVPLALYIASIASDFEDAIRLAVAYGGDSDTVGAIVGSLAEAQYPVPDDMKQVAINYLPTDMQEVYNHFEMKRQCKTL